MAIKRSPHNALLMKFWGNVQRGELRLGWLLQAAEWVVEREKRYKDIRIGSYRLPNASGSCFCCQKAQATVRHHIIQIQHGGRNFEKNIVGLCAACHRRVHPWLRRKPKPIPFDSTPRLVRSVSV